jgi:glycosyltransferase involved in cell wall biosynthesis
MSAESACEDLRAPSQDSVSGRRRRLLYVTPNFPPANGMGGSQVAISELASAAAARLDVTVLTTAFGGFAPDGSVMPRLDRSTPGPDARVSVVRLHMSRRARSSSYLPSPVSWWMIGKLVWAADGVHVSEFRTVLGLLVGVFCKAFRKPFVISPWGSSSTLGGLGRFRSARRWLWDHTAGLVFAYGSEAVFAQTSSEATASRRIAGVRRVLEVPLSLDIESWVSRYQDNTAGEDNRNRGLCTFISIARLHPLKNVPRLIEAFAALPEKSRLLIVGGDHGDEGRVRQIVADLNVESRVKILGPVYPPHIFKLLSMCDYSVLVTDYNEGTSLASLEAAAVGVVPIISSATDLPFLIDGIEGYRSSSTLQGLTVVLQLAYKTWASGDIEVMRLASRSMIERHHSISGQLAHYLEPLGLN